MRTHLGRQVDSDDMYHLKVNVASADLAKDFTIIIYRRVYQCRQRLEVTMEHGGAAMETVGSRSSTGHDAG